MRQPCAGAGHRFHGFFLPRFRGSDGAWLELHTKSTQVRTLLPKDAISNVVIDFSFTPEAVSRTLEQRVPSLLKRLAALSQLQRAGWSIGLRFDRLIYHHDLRAHCTRLFDQVIGAVDDRLLHTVTLGPFRMPAGYYRTITRHYPDEALSASPLRDAGGTVSYPADTGHEMVAFCRDQPRTRAPGTKFFAHTVANSKRRPPDNPPAPGIASGPGERLFDVRDDVVDVLDADGQPHQVFAHPGCRHLLR